MAARVMRIMCASTAVVSTATGRMMAASRSPKGMPSNTVDTLVTHCSFTAKKYSST